MDIDINPFIQIDLIVIIKEFIFTFEENDFYSIDHFGNTVFLEGSYKILTTDGQNIYDESNSFYNSQETNIVNKCPL